MRDPRTLPEQERLRQLVDSLNLQRAAFDDVRFWINPDSFNYTTEANIQEQPTAAGGWVVFDFATKPWEIVLEGWTGTMALFEMDSSKRLGQFRHQLGRSNRFVAFSYPGRFGGKALKVKIVQFRDMTEKGKPFAYRYQITMRCYGDLIPIYDKLPTPPGLAPPVAAPPPPRGLGAPGLTG